MKRMLQILLLSSALLTLSACGISKADYDSALSKNEALSDENKSLSSKIESLNADIDSLNQQLKELEDEKKKLEDEKSSIVKEYFDYKDKIVSSELKDSYGKAWVATSFGDSSICLISEDKTYLHCIASNKYEISEEGISDLWNAFIQSSITLSLVKSIDYQTISVRFYDLSDTFIMDIILENKNGKYALNAFSCNPLYVSIIMSVLSNK